MHTITEPIDSLPPPTSLTRPRVTHHLLAGAITVELPITHAAGAYVVTAQYARQRAESSPLVSVDHAAAEGLVPTRLVPAVLYLALDELWHLETAALNRDDAHSVTLWQGASAAIASFRADWLDAQADDLDEADEADEADENSPARVLLVLPGVAAPPLAVVS